MRKRRSNLLEFLIFFVLTIIVYFSLPSNAIALVGNGTSDSPYLIQTVEDFEEFAGNPDYWDDHIRLESDIDLSGNVYNSAVIAPSGGIQFTGMFDGNGYTINSLIIDDPHGSQYIGLFGQIGEDATVTALGLKNFQISQYIQISQYNCCIGGLAGINYGNIKDCYATGTITHGVYIGGLVGSNRGYITRSYADCSITGISTLGGLVGLNWNSIDSSYSSGRIQGNYARVVGGLVGENTSNLYLDTSISYCYSNVKIEVPENNENVGGLIGLTGSYDKGSVTLSFWDQEVSGISSSAGGFGRTTSQMMAASTYVGWRNGNWNIDEGNDYPRLAWQNQPGNPIHNNPVRLYSGTGSVNDPFILSNPSEIVNMSERPDDWDSYFILTNDIDMGSVTGYLPPGNFRGKIDGNFHTIVNLTVNESTAFIGFIGILGKGGQLTNLQVKNADFTGRYYTGSLVGFAEEATISRCGAEAKIMSLPMSSEIGGLIGKAIKSSITESFAEGSVILGIEAKNSGGLVGYSYSSTTIQYCYSNNSITVGDNSQWIGGLVGANLSSKILNSYSVSQITGYENSNDVGALVGDDNHDSLIVNSYWMIRQPGIDFSDGGFGRNETEMRDPATYIGWDSGIWSIDSGAGFPHLNWENTGGIQIDNIPVRTYTGSGTQNDPFIIIDAKDLLCMTHRPLDWGGYFVIQNDIDMSAVERYQPPAGFSGSLNGLGHKILNLNINEKTSHLGLIGRLERGEINNLHLENVVVTGYRNVGGLVGHNYSGTVMQCSFDGSINAIDNAHNIGGLIGISSGSGSVSQSFSSGLISGSHGVYRFGGLIGFSRGSVTNSFSHCRLTAGDSARMIAGFVGFSYGDITNCYSIGSISSGDTPEEIGGFIGYIGYGTVSNSFWDMEASGLLTSAAGEGKSTGQMKDTSTFLNAGWDFVHEIKNGAEDIWDMSNQNGYPVLTSHTAETITVPDVVGNPQAAAESAIIDAGLVVGDVTFENSQTVLEGLVISQMPATGQSVEVGSAVDLVISLGPSGVIVPNLVGFSQDAAEKAIIEAGLVVGSIGPELGENERYDKLISLTPSPGSVVSEGSVIDLLFSVVSFKPDAENVRLIGNWPYGDSQVVTVDAAKDLAFLGSGGGIYILDITDPSQPNKLSQVRTPGLVLGIAYFNDHLYVADGNAGLRIIDVSDPTAPFDIGFRDTDEAAWICLLGNYAYVAGGKSGLRIFDVTIPNAPVEIGSCFISGDAKGIFVLGNYAYVAAEYGGLRIIDVSDPTSPTEVGFHETQERAWGVYVVGNYAYVACYWGGLRIIDVSDPTSPHAVGFHDTSGTAYEVYVVGNYAYVADSSGGLKIIDISNPAVPTEVGSYRTWGWDEGVYVVGNYAYVADTSRGLFIIDVTNPNVPVEVGTFETVGSTLEVHVMGNYAYLANYPAGLRIIDISNPTSPDEVGFYDAEPARCVHVVGNYVYVVEDYALRIIDVTDPSAPAEVGSCSLPDAFSRGIHVVGNYAYVANWQDGLRVIDVTDPSSPVEVGFYDTTENVFDVYVLDNYAYIANDKDGLRIIDVTEPSKPLEVGFYDTPGYAYGVHVVGEYAYVTDQSGELRIIDVSDPTAPLEVGLHKCRCNSVDVYVQGNLAYVTGGYSNGKAGFQVIDVTDPSAPFEVGFYDTPDYGSGGDVHVSGNLAYVANQSGGLQILLFAAPCEGTIDLDVSSGTIEFGDVFVGTEALKSFDITNTGTCDLHVIGIKSSNDAFNLYPPTNFSIAAGGPAHSVTIGFTPDHCGEFSDTITTLNNAGTPVTLNVKGHGTDIQQKHLGAAPDQISVHLSPGEVVSGSLDLINFNDTSLTGITASVAGNSPNINIEITPPSIISGQTVQKVNYSVTANNDTTANSSPVLTFSSAEGHVARVTFDITVNPGYPKLVTNPAYLENTMVRGTQSFLEFELTNVGSVSVTNLKILLPSTGWLSLFTPDSIHSLDGGEKIKIGLSLNPLADLPLGPYTGNLALNADNTGTSVGFRFTAVSDKIGGLKITATDEFTYFADDHPPVSGASVKISNPYDGTLVAEGMTDGDGQFTVDDLAEGLYNVEVKADKHGTYNATIQIYPGQIREITAFLPRQLVTYTWKVVPVQTEDRYIVTLEAEFETHVPAPVVTVEPTLLDLSKLQYDTDGKATVNYTITNHGLIAANNASIHFGSHPAYQMSPLNENLGEIGPLTSVIVPVTVQKTSPSLLSLTAQDNDPSSLPCGVSACVEYGYVCIDDRWVETCVKVITGECPPIDPGTGGGTGSGPGKPGTGGGGNGGCLECGGTFFIGPRIFEEIPCEPEGQGPCVDCPTHLECVTCENGICIFQGCGQGPGDGSCVPPCGACTRCSNGECVPNDTCEDDGSCDPPCPRCYVCRNGECDRDARCDLHPGDGVDDSDPRDDGPDDDPPTVPSNPTIDPITEPDPDPGPGESATIDTGEQEQSTHRNNDKRADPILMFSGELLVETTDLKIPGRGFDFEFKRTYRSRFESNGVLGHGWEHNHMDRLIFPANTSELVLRSNGFGRIDVYRSLGGGRFKSPDGFFDELRRNADGTYTLRNFDGFTTHFSAGGITRPARMVSREDRHGNRMQYIYDDSPLGFPGPLVRVIDTLGRPIEFGYNDQGRLITVKDFVGRTIRFTYDRRGDLISARTPVVTGTSTNNDFPEGKTTHYEYYHNPFWVLNPRLKRLEHNLLTIWDPKGQNYLRVTYETNTSSYAYDRVIEQQHGTADQVNRLTYTKLNEDVPALPYDPDLPRNETVVVDRNGNRTVLIHNGRGQLLEERVETNRNVNPDDPDVFVTTHTYNKDANRLSTTFPEGNRIVYVFDSTNSDRLQQGNLLSVTREPGPRGGDQSTIKTIYTYEPIYNQVRTAVEARGNDATFVPQNGGVTSPERYTTLHTFDYQEASSFTVLPRLAAAINRDETEVADALTAAGISLDLGDVNGDGRTDQIVGNVVQKVQPTVNLLSSSRQASLEGDTTQEIISEFTYNRFGQIIAEIDPEGNVDEYFYYPERDPDGDGNVTPGVGLATDTGGYKREMIRDSRVSPRRRSTAPLTQIVNRWKYDPVGNVIETRDGRGNTTRYIVNALNQVERRISEAPFNYEHAYIYDATDNIIREEVQNVETNGPGLDASVTYTYDYDILDNRITKTEEVSTGEVLTTRYEYDRNENQTRIILPEGNVMERAYDERDLVFSLTRGASSPVASTQTFTYDGNGNLIKTVDAEDNNADGVGEATLVSYDGYNRKIRTVDAVGNVMTYHYDLANNVTREQSFGVNGGPSPTNNTGAGNVPLKDVEYRYDELSRTFETNHVLFANTRPVGPEGPLTPDDGRVARRQEYDRNNRLTRMLDDNNHEHVFEYDGADRVVLEVDELGNETRKTYDGNNNVTAVVEQERSPDGLVPDETFTTRFEYDTLDRRTALIDNLNNRTEYRYDSRNNLIGTTDALGNTRTYTYDGINRKLSKIVDLRIGGVGAGAIDTSNAANADGRISRLYDWDKNSRLAAETDDKGNVTTYVYDPLDRRIQEIFADTTIKKYTFDKDDNVIRYEDQNGSVCTYTYDGIHRLVHKNVSRAPGVEGTTEQRFEYDGLSRRTRAFDNNDPADVTDDSDVSFHYDSLDWLIAEVQNTVEVASRFDGVGNRLGLTYPNGRQMEMTYDGLDRLALIRNQGSAATIATYKYIGPMRVLERAYANGTRLLLHDESGNDVGYDAVKRTIQMRYNNAADVLFSGYTYAYDKQHNRRYELDQFLSVADVYEYDSAYRLTRTQTKVPAASVAGITNNNTTNADVEGLTGTNDIGYTLDGVGNRDSRRIDASTTTYAVNVMNEYDAIGGTTQVHDDNGNLTDDGNRRYVYDIHNRLMRVTDTGNNEIARYFYDGLNRRIKKQAGGSTTLYLYNQTQVVEERDGSGNTTKQFVYGSGIDEVLELTTGGQMYFYHENSIGSITVLTDGAGNVVERYRYGAYGETTILDPDGFTEIGDSLIDNPYRFTGRRYDTETGIYYYRARFYDPECGRFLQRDPKGYVDGMGLYEYVGSNPINFVDAFGTEKIAKDAANEIQAEELKEPTIKKEVLEGPTIAGAIEAGISGVVKKFPEEFFIYTSKKLAKVLAEKNLRNAKQAAREFVRTFREVGGRLVKAGIVKKGTKGTQELMAKLGPVLRAKGFLRAVKDVTKWAGWVSDAEQVGSLTISTFKTVELTARFATKFEIGPIEILGILPTYAKAYMMDIENNAKQRALLRMQTAPLVSADAGGSCDARYSSCIAP